MNASVAAPGRAARATGIVALIRRHPLIAYFVLAIGLSWLVELPLVLRAQGIGSVQVPYAVHYAASFGPLLAALAVTAAVDGGPGLRGLLARAARWRIGVAWWLVAVGSPFLMFGLGALASRLSAGTWPDLGRLGEVSFLGNIGLWVLPLWIATFGYAEETGWRGFALPRLQERRSALTASLVIAALWVVWHLPSFFYLPTYMELGLAMLPAFAVGVVLGAVLLTWLYNSTGGSILAVALWHALYDLVSASRATDVTANVVMSVVVMAWALAVLAAAGPARLAWPSARQGGARRAAAVTSPEH
jgi:membrane protease YdiL (CAAX protease family)